jgi:hypothetical protein
VGWQASGLAGWVTKHEMCMMRDIDLTSRYWFLEGGQNHQKYHNSNHGDGKDA